MPHSAKLLRIRVFGMSDSADWLLQAVDNIYEAALHPEHWQKVVEMVADRFGGGTTIFSHDLSGRSALMFKHHNLSQAAVEGYDAHYGTVNPWIPEMQRRPAGIVVHGDHLVPARDLQRTEFYADWLRPQQLASSFGVTLIRDSRFLTNIAVMLEPGRTEPSADDLKVLQTLVPHLQRALRIHHQINLPRAERNTLLDVLEKAGFAAITVDSDARVLSLTASAEALLGQKDGLTVRMGVLTVAAVSLDMRLKTAIRRAADSFGGDYLSIPRQDALRRPLNMAILPLRPFEDDPLRAAKARLSRSGAALVLLKNPETSPVAPASLLSDLYGLTPAEARLARSLATGQSLEDISGSYGVSQHTLRWRLKSLMSKMQVRRQGELIALVLRQMPFKPSPKDG